MCSCRPITHSLGTDSYPNCRARSCTHPTPLKLLVRETAFLSDSRPYRFGFKPCSGTRNPLDISVKKSENRSKSSSSHPLQHYPGPGAYQDRATVMLVLQLYKSNAYACVLCCRRLLAERKALRPKSPLTDRLILLSTMSGYSYCKI